MDLPDGRADYTAGGVTGVISERAGSTSKYYHGDEITSTRGMTNSSQSITDSREYDAWGLALTTSALSTAFGFAGGQGYQRDPDSGLMLLGERYYDPAVGRFISRDPSGYSGASTFTATHATPRRKWWTRRAGARSSSWRLQLRLLRTTGTKAIQRTAARDGW